MIYQQAKKFDDFMKCLSELNLQIDDVVTETLRRGWEISPRLMKLFVAISLKENIKIRNVLPCQNQSMGMGV